MPATETTQTFADTTAENGQTYYYRVYPMDTAGKIGFGSVEAESHPHAVSDVSDIHVVQADGSSPSCGSCHRMHDAGPGTNDLLFSAGGPNEDPTCLSCHSLKSGLASTDTSSEIGDPNNESAIPMWTAAVSGRVDDLHELPPRRLGGLVVDRRASRRWRRRDARYWRDHPR